MNTLASAARDHHRKSGDGLRAAEVHRRQRDEAIRRLWRTERSQWTYAKLAKAIGCSPELIAKIITGRS